MGDFRADQTWFGFAVKGGGFLAIAGVEGAEGVAGRLDQFSSSLSSFNVTSFRFGLGLGGSVGLSVFLAFNLPTFIQLNGLKVEPALKDFNVNIALEMKVPLANSFKALQPIASRVAAASRYAGGLKTGIGALSLADISTLRDFAHLYWQANIEGSDAVASRTIKTMLIDIPTAGAGMELSLYWTKGEYTVS